MFAAWFRRRQALLLALNFCATTGHPRGPSTLRAARRAISRACIRIWFWLPIRYPLLPRAPIRRSMAEGAAVEGEAARAVVVEALVAAVAKAAPRAEVRGRQA